MSRPPAVAVAAVLAIAVAITIGCASEPTATERWVREVRVIEPWQLGDRSYDELGVLVETEPIRAVGEEAAVDTAKNRLRRRAAELDGDAVVVGFCERGVDPRDPGTRLRPTVVCEGLVVRWLAPGA